jgi:hypothetical protein
VAGKWAFLKGVVDEIEPAESAGYAERLATLKAALSDKNFEQLSDSLTLAQARKDKINAELSEAKLEVTVLERLVIEKLESAGIESITAGGYKLTPSIEPQFKKIDGAALRKYIEETHQEELLTVQSQTLTSLAKDHYLQTGEVLPGLELSGTFTKLSRTKSK